MERSRAFLWLDLVRTESGLGHESFPQSPLCQPRKRGRRFTAALSNSTAS